MKNSFFGTGRRKAGLLLLLALPFAGALAQDHTLATITLKNPSDRERVNEVVEISWKEIVLKHPAIDTAGFKVVDAATRQELPCQLDHSGGNGIQNLLVQLSFKPGGERNLDLVAGHRAPVVSKVYGRYVPERYDDFAWENDLVAHRMYGKALESRPDNAFGTDVWVKKTSKLVINDWYKRGDYHTDHGDGMDYYSVGFTLGAGDIAPYVNDSVIFSKNYHFWKVLDNGPLRVSFQLGYDAWDVAGRQVKVIKTISLDAGSRMNRVAAVYSFKGAEPLPVVIGVVKRKEAGTVLMGEQQGLLGYWEPPHAEDGITGVGTIAVSPVSGMDMDRVHLMTHVMAQNNVPVVYYHGSAWSKGGSITNDRQWFDYLQDFNARMKQPVIVQVR